MEVTQPTPMEQRISPLHRLAGRLHQQLDELSSVLSVSGMSPEETAETLVELTRVLSRVEGLRAAVLAHGEAVDVAAVPVEAEGRRRVSSATSTSAWMAAATVVPLGHARRLVRVSERLDTDFEATGEALQAGQVDLEQAQVIVAAVDRLPAAVGVELRRSAEKHLLSLAGEHDARALKILGRHLHEVVDPDGAEAELGRRLAAEEEAANRSTVLFLRDDGEGTCHGRFKIPSLHGAMLTAALNAIASPKRPGAIPRQHLDPEQSPKSESGPSQGPAEGPTPVDLTAPEVLGQALCEYVERFPGDALPDAGGTDATVVVTMTLEQLQTDLASAQLDTGQSVSAGEARRLACQAGIIPMVLGADSVVLDAGRKARLHTAAMRRALRVQHRTCTAEGCTVPSAWCHAHHCDPWALGGRTSVRRGTLLCPRHHRLAHRPDHEVSYPATGVTRITKTRRRRP